MAASRTRTGDGEQDTTATVEQPDTTTTAADVSVPPVATEPASVPTSGGPVTDTPVIESVGVYTDTAGVQHWGSPVGATIQAGLADQTLQPADAAALNAVAAEKMATLNTVVQEAQAAVLAAQRATEQEGAGDAGPAVPA